MSTDSSCRPLGQQIEHSPRFARLLVDYIIVHCYSGTVHTVLFCSCTIQLYQNNVIVIVIALAFVIVSCSIYMTANNRVPHKPAGHSNLGAVSEREREREHSDARAQVAGEQHALRALAGRGAVARAGAGARGHHSRADVRAAAAVLGRPVRSRRPRLLAHLHRSLRPGIRPHRYLYPTVLSTVLIRYTTVRSLYISLPPQREATEGAAGH